MIVAISRIREYLLSEECSFPSREAVNEDRESEDARKRVTINSQNYMIVFIMFCLNRNN